MNFCALIYGGIRPECEVRSQGPKTRPIGAAWACSLMQVAVPFAELVHATSNFAPSQILGRGGLGPVFTGRWREYDVAVKVCCTPFFWPSAAPRRARAAAHVLMRSPAPLSPQQRRPRRDTAVATRPAVFACSRPPARRATPRVAPLRAAKRLDAAGAGTHGLLCEVPRRSSCHRASGSNHVVNHRGESRTPPRRNATRGLLALSRRGRDARAAAPRRDRSLARVLGRAGARRRVADGVLASEPLAVTAVRRRLARSVDSDGACRTWIEGSPLSRSPPPPSAGARARSVATVGAADVPRLPADGRRIAGRRAALARRGDGRGHAVAHRARHEPRAALSPQVETSRVCQNTQRPRRRLLV